MLCPCTYIYCSDGSIFLLLTSRGEPKEREKKKMRKTLVYVRVFTAPAADIKVKRTAGERGFYYSAIGSRRKVCLRVDLLSAVFCLVSFSLPAQSIYTGRRCFHFLSPLTGTADSITVWPREWHSQVNGGQLSITFFFFLVG